MMGNKELTLRDVVRQELEDFDISSIKDVEKFIEEIVAEEIKGFREVVLDIFGNDVDLEVDGSIDSEHIADVKESVKLNIQSRLGVNSDEEVAKAA